MSADACDAAAATKAATLAAHRARKESSLAAAGVSAGTVPGLRQGAAAQVAGHAAFIDHEYDGAAFSETSYPRIPFEHEIKVGSPAVKPDPGRAQNARVAVSVSVDVGGDAMSPCPLRHQAATR